MLLSSVVAVSEAVRGTSSRRAKVDAIAALLRGASRRDAELATRFLAGSPRQGRLGVGWATLRDVSAAARSEPALTAVEVDEAFEELAHLSGPGSEARRRDRLKGLLAGATTAEQAFLRALLLQDVRQGANEGVVVAAVAEAAGVPVAAVRRALMMSGDLGEVAGEAVSGGEPALAAFRLTLFRPLQPMLAATASSIAAALGEFGEAVLEHKYDGARIQVHREGKRTEVYTRNLKEATGRVPEIVAAAGAVAVDSIVLDGEAMALDETGRPHPFQVTMGRFGAGSEAGSVRLTPFFFDVLYLDGEELIDRPAAERHQAMQRVLPAEVIVPRLVTGDAGEAGAFFRAALAAGHEGVVAKDPQSTYEAGRRGSSWLKVKPVHTLDLVVLAAEWGHGRRRGWLSNLHLGARDPRTGGFVMLGKTFKGLTDEMLAWQTGRFLELERGRRGGIVVVRPEQVVEVAFDGVQASPRYPGGVALRFARIKGYRHDKPAGEADTIDTVLAIHRGEVSPG